MIDSPERPLRSPPQNIGFTLIELLVVIAIIGVLTALAIPAVNKARIKSMRAVTVGNLHQVNLAFTGYVNDNGWVLPVGYQYADTNRPELNWRQLLVNGGYLGKPDKPVLSDGPWCFEYSVLGSPLQRRNNPRLPKWDQNTFGANAQVLSLNPSGQPVSNETRMLQFRSPSRTILMAEGSTLGGSDCRFNGLFYGTPASNLPNYLEGGLVSCLFLDGHVDTMRLADWPPCAVNPVGSDSWYFWKGRE